MRKEFKNFCKRYQLEILEYMGKTKWYYQNSLKGYKRFLSSKEHIYGNNSYTRFRPVHYWMCRYPDSGKIVYYGYTKTTIVKLHRHHSIYVPNEYKKNKNGSITPKANGHMIVANCWESESELSSWKWSK